MEEGGGEEEEERKGGGGKALPMRAPKHSVFTILAHPTLDNEHGCIVRLRPDWPVKSYCSTGVRSFVAT